MKFTPTTFPDLRHLVLRLDRKQTMLPRLAKFAALETLAISPNYDAAIFDVLNPARLTALYLGGGTLQTLDGIEQLQQLVAVGLSRMDKLESITALTRLPNLAEVSIHYCANLAQYDPLLEMPTLEQLTIIGCKRFKQGQYRPLFQGLNLKMLTLL